MDGSYSGDRGLPKYVFKKRSGKDEYYFRRRGWGYMPICSPDHPDFWAEYEKLLSPVEIQHRVRPRKAIVGDKIKALEKHLSDVQRSARSRATKSGREFSLPLNWSRDNFLLQGGLCLATGLAMSKSLQKHDPWAPSIDRIDCDKGYTPENCRLVAYIYNCARNQFSDADLLTMCHALVHTEDEQ